jgi:lactate dehydrogenase-like 2-hydroxyacid dehydrogenase
LVGNLLIGTDLTGKKIGIVGGGAIGYQVASILAHGFDCSIIYSDVSRNEKLETLCDAKFVSNETLFKTSDIISIHIPLSDKTHHFVDKGKFSLMKKDSYLINTSRGAVVDEQSLVTALKNKSIAGAGLDVYEFEPKITEELLSFSNVVLTPHIASARISVRQKMSSIVANNIISYFENKEGVNNVY